MTLAQTERAALADLFAAVGPDQPTRCEGWDTADLLVHLLIRERRLDTLPGLFLSPLAGWTERVAEGYRNRPFDEQIELLRSGPPAFSPFAWGPMDEKANGMEMFVHHEDVRRGQPDWQPRELDEATRAQLLSMVSSALVQRKLRKVGVPTTARLTDEIGEHQRPIVLVPAKTHEALGEDPGGVVLTGGVAEILLFLTGRSEVRVVFDGKPDAVAAVRAIAPPAITPPQGR